MATRVQGADRLRRKLVVLSPAAKSAIRQALAESADEITGMQRRLVPEDSGDLKRSIKQTWGGGKAKYASLKGSGGPRGDPDLTVDITAGDTRARYAHIVEFGQAPHPQGGKFVGTMHPGTAPRPFFFPAYRALKKRTKSRIRRAVKRSAKQAAAAGR